MGAVRLKPDTTETRALAPVGLTPDTIGDDAFAAVVSGFSRTTAVVSGFSRTTGRSIADVSNPSLAATSAAADSSPAVGFSGSTMRAFTKSTAPSPLRSWNTTPGLKNSDNDTAGSPGAVRPNAPKLIMTRKTRKSLFMSITRMCSTYERYPDSFVSFVSFVSFGSLIVNELRHALPPVPSHLDRRQNWKRIANSACREGALMFGSSVVL